MVCSNLVSWRKFYDIELIELSEERLDVELWYEIHVLWGCIG